MHHWVPTLLGCCVGFNSFCAALRDTGWLVLRGIVWLSDGLCWLSGDCVGFQVVCISSQAGCIALRWSVWAPRRAILVYLGPEYLRGSFLS